MTPDVSLDIRAITDEQLAEWEVLANAATDETFDSFERSNPQEAGRRFRIYHRARQELSERATEIIPALLAALRAASKLDVRVIVLKVMLAQAKRSFARIQESSRDSLAQAEAKGALAMLDYARELDRDPFDEEREKGPISGQSVNKAGVDEDPMLASAQHLIDAVWDVLKDGVRFETPAILGSAAATLQKAVDAARDQRT